jgi:hypothetical protein
MTKTVVHITFKLDPNNDDRVKLYELWFMDMQPRIHFTEDEVLFNSPHISLIYPRRAIGVFEAAAQ